VVYFALHWCNLVLRCAITARSWSAKYLAGSDGKRTEFFSDLDRLHRAGVIYLPYPLVIRIIGNLASYDVLLDSVFRIIESLLIVLYTVFTFRVSDTASGEA
jgi:hypothetical protein